MEIAGEKVVLKLLVPADATDSYLSWMRDGDVNQYLESRWSTHSSDSLRQFIIDMNEPVAGSRKNYFFGIFLKSTGEHIGNIKIGNIDDRHRFADLGLLIGNKAMHGKGYGAESIALATRFAFEELKLNKLIAGIYEPNTGSRKAFIKAGYTVAGILKKHRLYKGKYVDEILVEKLRDA